jgi:hypothetical protein
MVDYLTMKMYGVSDATALFKIISKDFPPYREWEKYREQSGKCTVNEHKLWNNIIRARGKVLEYALCNNWDYFITLTLSPEKIDRQDLKGFVKQLGRWLDNYSKLKIWSKNIVGESEPRKIKYLLIPERHKDGAWHMHGLLKGLPLDHLTPFTLKDNIPKKIKALIKAGRSIYNWLPYAERFGWVTAETVRDRDAVSQYITKYIHKAMILGNMEINRKLYYCSQGLNTAEVVLQSVPCYIADGEIFDFANAWCKIKWLGRDESFPEEIEFVD